MLQLLGRGRMIASASRAFCDSRGGADQMAHVVALLRRTQKENAKLSMALREAQTRASRAEHELQTHLGGDCLSGWQGRRW